MQQHKFSYSQHLKDYKYQQPIKRQEPNVTKKMMNCVISKVLRSIFQKTTSENIIASFTRAGYVSIIKDHSIKVYVDIKHASLVHKLVIPILSDVMIDKLTPPCENVVMTTAIIANEQTVVDAKDVWTKINNTLQPTFEVGFRIYNQLQNSPQLIIGLPLDLPQKRQLQLNLRLSPDFQQHNFSSYLDFGTTNSKFVSKYDLEILSMPPFDNNGIRRPFTVMELEELGNEVPVD
ncbi:hypothetical protein EIN_441130 [Entamoeba invadens IP1]|uniref:Uncharacterized protein n=1 Tax=Entamoeba invadens IP1 TaxID=370355 RepID=A0A0A1TUT5_ENTIV|nr:hypothetical protein EIN_441130 [Entamoeba invadens IP1]ELP83909.1 hypothetical protein EIN_441130 [Entamoeba invadens IP1]|eukprot:XP_004183255.1 hypothetical protein EIN_441130 [Entamoeba invadens IP1]